MNIRITSVFWSTSFTIDMILKFTVLVFISDIKKKGERECEWEYHLSHIFRSLLNLFTYTPPSHSLFCLYIKLLENMNPYKAMCTSSDIDKINLSFYMPNNFVCLAFLPVRKKNVCLYMYVRLCVIPHKICVCLKERVFIKFDKEK